MGLLSSSAFCSEVRTGHGRREKVTSSIYIIPHQSVTPLLYYLGPHPIHT